eukprot:s130_g29.t1
MATDPGGSSSDESRNNLWNLLPSFDPAIDDIREYSQKVRFLHGVCPPSQRPMLAPRLAMLCKGTAWNQVRSINAEKLTSGENGVKVLLEALASWEETEEMVTFEKFERALYKIQQKNDESTMSFTNRLNVAFADLGDDVKVQDFKAFVLLRQSCLTGEDKKKILTMTSGKLESKAIDQAMRSLATRVLTGSTEQRKKVYPTNYTEDDVPDTSESLEPAWHASAYQIEDDYDDTELIEQLAQQGDADALVIQSFESDLEDLFQSTPDLQTALVSYQEARMKVSERKRYRGFWPSGKGFSSYKGKGKGKKGGGKTGSKSSLLERIARTNCKLCGERGHWRAECPNRNKEAANVALSLETVPETAEASPNEELESQHVLVENLSEEPSLHSSNVFSQSKLCASVQTCLFFSEMGINGNRKGDKHNSNGVSWKERAVSFLTQRFAQRKSMPSDDVVRRKAFCPIREPEAALNVSADGSYAVLDTGASRSVIGSDLVPSLLKDLPAEVQKAVKQIPSNVGFRFGNNHVSYSHAQLRIPMMGHKKRVWLLVEVVKGSTPFLMSIHAMKCLGAQIDLSSNQVYLNTLQRSMNIHENNNGLYMVRLRELCQFQPNLLANAESVFHSQPLTVSETSQSLLNDRQSSLPHAEPSRYDSDNQGNLRASSGEPEGSVVPSCEPGRSAQHVTAGTHREVRTHDAVALRSESPEDQDRRDQQHAQAFAEPSTSCQPGSDQCRFRPGVGSRISSDGSNLSSSSTCSKPCSSEPASTFGAAAFTECTSDVSPSEPSRESDRGSDSQLGVLAPKVHQLGKEVAWHQIPGSVRDGPELRPMDRRSIKHTDSANEGLPSVLSDSPQTGESDLDMCSNLVQQDPCELLSSSFLTDKFELSMIAEAMKNISPKKSVDLLEVYTEPDSRLAQEVKNLGGTALRFTREDGDLSTRSGQCKLLRWILEYSPKHLWLAPECLPWCAWARFNKQRSLVSWLEIEGKQEESRIHLMFCSLLMKIQREANRHTHMENPDTSLAWSQPELEQLVMGTILARFDQCLMGLKHPQNHKFLKKRTAVRTTSIEMHQLLDERFCTGHHIHTQIAGSCKFRGKSVPVSRFAAYYPTGLAKRIAKCIMKSSHTMVDCPIFHVDEISAIDPRETKRHRIEHESSTSEMHPTATETVGFKSRRGVKKESKERRPKQPQFAESEHTWAPVFQQMRSSLPRVGAKEFRAGETEFILCQERCPEMNVLQVKACKGVERFMTGDANAELRHTIVLRRFSNKIEDLGTDFLPDMSQNSQRGRAGSCHIMICVFGNKKDSSSSSIAPANAPDVSREASTSDEVPELPAPSAIPMQDVEPLGPVEEHADTLPSRSFGIIQPWTPASVSQSGPKYEALSSANKAFIRKLHHNLGHPTAEKLATHLAYQGADPEIIAGAKEYQCSACVERRPPKQGVPGALKSSTEFNEVIGIDGFEWHNEHIRVYVLHAIDEVTKFHLGKRTIRDSNIAQKCFTDFWMTWAGSPQLLYFDAAGEFLAQPWQAFLQSEGIQHKLTASAWQRGQAERHGGIIKEMLYRMNQEKPILNVGEFDKCLQQCFRAKNSLCNNQGYSPEQCVLGKATKLPASTASDETSSSHLLAEDSIHPMVNSIE